MGMSSSRVQQMNAGAGSGVRGSCPRGWARWAPVGTSWEDPGGSVRAGGCPGHQGLCWGRFSGQKARQTGSIALFFPRRILLLMEG